MLKYSFHDQSIKHFKISNAKINIDFSQFDIEINEEKFGKRFTLFYICRKNNMFFEHIKSNEDLKAEYRRLARQYHPDLGGDGAVFSSLTEEYEICKSKLGSFQKMLSDVQIGDTVWVNGTECEVTWVGTEVFIARAKGRAKHAVFNKSTGYGLSNSKYRASLINTFFKTQRK